MLGIQGHESHSVPPMSLVKFAIRARPLFISVNITLTNTGPSAWRASQTHRDLVLSIGFTAAQSQGLHHWNGVLRNPRNLVLMLENDPPVVPFCRFFLGEGSPTKIDYRKSLILTSLVEDLDDVCDCLASYTE